MRVRKLLESWKNIDAMDGMYSRVAEELLREWDYASDDILTIIRQKIDDLEEYFGTTRNRLNNINIEMDLRLKLNILKELEVDIIEGRV